MPAGDDAAVAPTIGSWFRELQGAEPRALTAISVGAAVFEIEQRVQAGHALRRVEISVYGAEACSYALDALGRILRDVLLFVLVRDLEIGFVRMPFQAVLEDMSVQVPTPPQLCLFSGGIDSFSGSLLAGEKYPGTEAVFCAHADQSHLIRIVENLKGRLSKHGVSTETVRVPRMGSRGYMQLRGFLYVLAAGLRMAITGADTLVVTECGPTMFQPRFSPVDSVTMTTHPEVLRAARGALEVILGRTIRVLTPFANLTKAEVVALSPDQTGVGRTHSCISQRFGDHDGTCYGCVIRRLATIAADSPDVEYRRDPLSDERANAGNLMTLLSFGHDILTRYAEMEDYEKGAIEQFGKRSLFRRFALDNFAAIHRLVAQDQRLRSDVRRLYDFARTAIGSDRLEKRLDALQRKSFRPDWRVEVPL